MITISLDAMGGDDAPESIVEGALLASELNVNLVLFGDETKINKLLNNRKAGHITIKHTEEEVSMSEKPISFLKKLKTTSLGLATKFSGDDLSHGTISAGHSGASVVAASKYLKRKDVRKPVLGTFIPTSENPVFLLDVGANVDTKAEDLLMFAQLGSEFYSFWSGKKNPTVGLLNIGSEKGKGDRESIKAYDLMDEASSEGLFNFVGNIEGRQVGGQGKEINVVVCDGFVGNVILKFAEGIAVSLMEMLASGLKESARSNIFIPLAKGGIKKSLKSVKKRLDYSEYGGAPLLGLKKPFFICHGSSNPKAIFNAIKHMKNLIMRQNGEKND